MWEFLSGPMVLVFVLASGFFFLLFVFLEGAPGKPGGRRGSSRGPARLGDFALLALPRLGAPLMPADEEKQSRLQQRLIHAGYYGRSALPRFLGVRATFLVVAALAGAGIGFSGLLELAPSLLLACALVALAFVAPGLWLDWQKRERQRNFRHALPDVLDIITICLEGGLSLPEALRRVTEELQAVHPLLGDEFNIIQRETLLGLSPGEALRKFAARSDLSEARDLAAVIVHAERYGVSMVNAMRVEADGMRRERQQRAEEMAQKAAVKVLFPTLLFIFPAIFVVVVGPAVYGIVETFANMK